MCEPVEHPLTERDRRQGLSVPLAVLRAEGVVPEGWTVCHPGVVPRVLVGHLRRTGVAWEARLLDEGNPWVHQDEHTSSLPVPVAYVVWAMVIVEMRVSGEWRDYRLEVFLRRDTGAEPPPPRRARLSGGWCILRRGHTTVWCRGSTG